MLLPKREVNSIETRQGRKELLIVLSFRDFDWNQGQRFWRMGTWAVTWLLLVKLREICQLTVGQATAKQVIKPYTKFGFPPESGFIHPNTFYLMLFAFNAYSRKECIIGYFEDNIFQIVFLDKTMNFGRQKKKNSWQTYKNELPYGFILWGYGRILSLWAVLKLWCWLEEYSFKPIRT